METYPKAYLYRRVVQAKQYIDQHFAEPLNLDNIATEACFSKYHFIRLFHRAYGKTPHQYLQWLRVEQAKQILKEEDAPIAEVCFRVGFNSLGYFSDLFKKYSGQTPAAYREFWQARKQHLRKRPLNYIPGCFAADKGFIEFAISKK